MRFPSAHISVCLVLVLLVSACGPRKIGKKDMERIMAEMLIQDQQIKQSRDLKRQADTSLVYEGIFQAYGYDTDDFLYSLTYYVEDAARMEKIMGNVAERLEKESKALEKEIDLERWKDNLMRIYKMKPDTTRLPRQVSVMDTLKVRFSGDSAWVEKPVNPLAHVPADSLLFLRDTVAEELPDSLVSVIDTLKYQKPDL